MARARVLVVEDEVDVAATLLDQLAGLDYEVTTATTAKEAFGLSGPGLLTMFAERHPRLPVIVVTSAVDPRVVAQIVEKKPFHLVHKPYDLDALDRLISAAARDDASAGRALA